MKILVVGSGAREHALVAAFKRSKKSCLLFCYGNYINPGIQSLVTDYIVGELNQVDFIVKTAKSLGIQLVVIGPEAPLEHGLADACWEAKIPTIGPYQSLAQIETSKGFARNLMQKYKISGLPKYKNFASFDKSAHEFLRTFDANNYVIKADGLMGGKGVKIANEHLYSFEEAEDFCKSIVAKGQAFIIEEKLQGQEFSLMCFYDGETLVPMPVVQDHKRAYNNDLGPNTGGMGSYSDANHSLPFLTDEDLASAFRINHAVLQALQTELVKPYIGILYGSFIATKDGVFVIEFNARFGDPEALNVLAILETDLVDIVLAMVSKTLVNEKIKFSNKATVCKYTVPMGYPDAPEKNFPVDVSMVSSEQLYLASICKDKEILLALGSRTAAYVGIGETIAAAEKIAEQEISLIKGPLFHRTDIGTESFIQKKIADLFELRQDLCELQS